MQKIIIKNFGPVKDAEIELKKVLVLIGEQASGKSTIAKLVYFFRSLKQELTSSIFLKKNGGELIPFFEQLIREKFIKWFGQNTLNTPFRLKYFYQEQKYLEISYSKHSSTLDIKLELIDEKFIQNADRLVREIKLLEEEEGANILLRLVHSKTNADLTNEVERIFNIHQKNDLFVVAGRSATIAYSSLLEKKFFSELQYQIITKQEQKLPSVDDLLMFDFIQYIDRIKHIPLASFLLYPKHSDLKDLISIPLLKASHEYNKETQKEFLIPTGSKNLRIPLNEASSGQKEVIRLLQDLFSLTIKKATKAFRIIEEPEAHLFPIAQKQLVELFALMVNQNEHNQLIITTHSPYILSAFNNLLFAQRVVDKNPAMEAEVSEVIDKAYHLKGDDFAAYSLGNTSFAKGEYAYCESIVNPKTQLIAQNYLDEVSAMLGAEFNTLYELHAKKFARA